MKNVENWEPSKIDWRPDGSWSIRASGVTAASYLTATVAQAALIPLVRQYLRGRVADVGAGAVPFYPCYRDQAESIVCVDWAASPHESDRHSDILTDLNAAIPMPDQSIDGILMSSVLEHIAEPRRMLCELHRILAPGGSLVLEVPFYYWLHEEPHDYYRYTAYALERMARESGFEVALIEPYGNGLVVLADLSAKVSMIIGRQMGLLIPFWPVRRAWNRTCDALIRVGQRLATLMLARGPLARCFKGSALEAKFPLGYVAVLRRPPQA